MKKIILAAVVILTITASACTKENVQPAPIAAAHNTVTLADKANLAQIDVAPGDTTKH